MKPKTLTINGKPWKFKRLKRVIVDGVECDGSCCRRTKTLEVKRDLEGEYELEVVVHEIRHALNDYLDEEYVDRESRDIAAALWLLGYRKLAPEKA
jgi:hypothetical protein